jgi:hypothetical protein
MWGSLSQLDMARSTFYWQSASETGKKKRKNVSELARLVDQRYLIGGINFLIY